jgi:hypothetical protein
MEEPMRFIKALGLILVLAAGAIVFFGPSPASTRADTEEDKEIVLCMVPAKPLCPELDEVWPKGKIITASLESGTDLKLSGGLTTLCKEVQFKGPIITEMAEVLLWQTTEAKIGQCEGGCSVASVQNLPVGEIRADEEDKYLLLILLTVKFTKCIFGVECTFKGDSVLEIADPNTGGIPQALAKEEPMSLASGSEIVCGKTGHWDARLVLTGGSLTVLYELYDLGS